MHMVDLTFRCYLTDEQLQSMRDLQDQSDFGMLEAVEILEHAHDSALIRVNDESV